MNALRLPEQNEVALSPAEVRFAVRKKLIAKPSEHFVETDPDDEPDAWPVYRVIKPAGCWGIKKPGLRHAQPFDGLAA